MTEDGRRWGVCSAGKEQHGGNAFGPSGTRGVPGRPDSFAAGVGLVAWSAFDR